MSVFIVHKTIWDIVRDRSGISVINLQFCVKLLRNFILEKGKF